MHLFFGYWNNIPVNQSDLREYYKYLVRLYLEYFFIVQCTFLNFKNKI